jgi:hypothetical protein
MNDILMLTQALTTNSDAMVRSALRDACEERGIDFVACQSDAHRRAFGRFLIGLGERSADNYPLYYFLLAGLIRLAAKAS